MNTVSRYLVIAALGLALGSCGNQTTPEGTIAPEGENCAGGAYSYTTSGDTDFVQETVFDSVHKQEQGIFGATTFTDIEGARYHITDIRNTPDDTWIPAQMHELGRETITKSTYENGKEVILSKSRQPYGPAIEVCFDTEVKPHGVFRDIYYRYSPER